MPESKPLTIVELRAQNVKRLNAVRIRPNGAAVVLGGANGQGKSSVLDAITYALGGKDVVCRQPVRRGAETAEVIVDLDEYVVKRTWKKDGSSTLVVQSKDGARFPSPQTLLDRLAGTLTFDPLAFARMKPEGQADTLRGLVGLDFRALEAEAKEVYDKRTVVNRDEKALKVRVSSAPFHAGTPEAEISAASILQEEQVARDAWKARTEKARETNRAHEAKRQDARDAGASLARAKDAVQSAQIRIDDTKREIERLRLVLGTQEQELATRAAAATKAEEHFGVLRQAAGLLVDDVPEEPDWRPFRRRVEEVEATNVRVRANLEHARLERRLAETTAEAARLTKRLEEIDQAKAAAIAAAKMPVEGLAFDANGVTVAGFPFDQASQAEQLRVSVAMGFAMNPRLRVLLIRDASLLDADSMDLVTRMAEERGGQVWLERVGRDGSTTVLIEDGEATAVETPAAAAAE